MRSIFTLISALLLALVAQGQTRINPTSQINWPLITGAGTPTAVGVPCASVNIGQPYQDTAVVPNTAWNCGTNGTGGFEWAENSGSGSVTLSNGIVVGTGSGGTNTPASALDLASPENATDSGSLNTYVLTTTPTVSSLVNNLTVSFLPNSSSTTPTPTANLDGLGAFAIVRENDASLAGAGDVGTNLATIKWNASASKWELQNPQNIASTVSNTDTTTTITPTHGNVHVAVNLASTNAWTGVQTIPLGNGSTAVTQTVGDNTTKVATDAFVMANAAGSGTVSTCGTAKLFAFYAATGTTVSCDTLLSDSGTQLTYSGSGGIAVTGDGVHAGSAQLIGNTTVPALAPNTFSIVGPNLASLTSFAWQAPSATNGSAGLVHIAANVSGYSQMSISPVSLSADVSGSLPHANIAATAVTPGSYTNANITVAADGSLTAATNGSGGGGAVTSVANSDGTLTISPTTGTVVASLALGHANTWTAAQGVATTDSLTGGSTVSYLQSNINALNIQTEFQGQQGGGNAINGEAGAVSAASSATIHQTNGVAGFVDNASTSTNAVGGYFQAVGKASNVNLWGDNPLCATSTTGTGDLCRGSEVDVNFNNTGDSGEGVDIIGGWTAQPSASTMGVFIEEPVAISGGPYHWTYAFRSAPGAAVTGLRLGPTAATGNNIASQPILLENFNGGGSLVASTIQADSAGDVVINAGSGTTQVDNLNVTGSCTGCGSTGIANITIAVTGATQGANSCTSPATATHTGVTTSSHVTASYTANPASLTGWGSTGGMVFQVWPSATNTDSWIACNQTASSITFSSITFSIGAQ